jgi:MFS family permease
VGLGGLPIVPITLSLIGDLYAPEQRGRASMVTLVGQFAGVGIVFALGGALITMFDSQPDAWRRALFWLTVPLLVLVLLSILALREPRRTERLIENPSARESFAEFWRYRAMIAPLLIGGTLAIIAIQSVMIWTAPTLSRVFELAPHRVGAIMAFAVPIGGIGGSITGGILADLCQRTGGPRRTISTAGLMALLSVPLCLFAIAPGVVAVSIMLALSIAILTTISQMATTVAIVVVPNELRGLYVAVSAGMGAIFGIGLAPLLVSSMSGAIGGPAMIGKSLAIVCATASVLSAATLTFGSRNFPREATQ